MKQAMRLVSFFKNLEKMEIEELVRKSWSEDALLWNKSPKEWIKKWCSDDVVMKIEQVPEEIQVVGKENVSVAFESLCAKTNIACYEYEFDSAFFSKEDDRSVIVLGKMKYNIEGKSGHILTVDRIRFDESDKVEEISLISDISGWNAMHQEALT
jgi:hypothetical protein